MLDWLHPSQLIYCDTDYVTFVVDENDANHKIPINGQVGMPTTVRFGNALGEWGDELKGKCTIEEGVWAGAKSYAYKTTNGKTEVKQKGITIDRNNASCVTFDLMKDMVTIDRVLETKKRFSFRWDARTKDIHTVYMSRNIKSKADSNRKVDGFETVPLGWLEKDVEISSLG